MKKTLEWIVLVWTVLALPSALTASEDFSSAFFVLVYMGLIVGLMIHDLRQ